MGVAHSRASGVGGNRGITRNSNVGSGSGSGSGHAPMCVDPLIAHGSPTTTHNDRPKISSFQQKPALAPQKPRPPMCNTNDNHTRSTHPPRLAPRSVHFRLEIGPIQLERTDVETRTTSSRAKATCRTSEPSESSRPVETRPISTRKWTDLEPKYDRSRHGERPISTRVSTDLGAEADRSRREFRPISTRKRTDLGAELDRSRRLLL